MQKLQISHFFIFLSHLFSVCYGNKNTSYKWQCRYAFFYFYPWEALGICSSIFIILLEIYRFKLLKLPKNFVVANQFLNWICRLKSDYDDVVKKNQELENRILQLVMLLPFWSNCWPHIHDWNENFWHLLPASSTGFQWIIVFYSRHQSWQRRKLFNKAILVVRKSRQNS